MSQTSYNVNMDAAFAGLIASMRSHEIESYRAENVMQFGRAAVAGTDVDGQVKQPTAGGVFRGVALHSVDLPQAAGGPVGIASGDMVNVGRRGVFWVTVSGAVTTDSPAFFVDANGLFAMTAGAGKTAVPTGVFRSAAMDGGLAKVEINLP